MLKYKEPISMSPYFCFYHFVVNDFLECYGRVQRLWVCFCVRYLNVHFPLCHLWVGDIGKTLNEISCAVSGFSCVRFTRDFPEPQSLIRKLEEWHKDDNKSILMTFLLILGSRRQQKTTTTTNIKKVKLNLQYIAATPFFLELEHFHHSSKQRFHFLLPSEVDVCVIIYLPVSYV